MKKKLLILILIAGCVAFAIAQPRAIGGRIAYGVGFSYQHSFGAKNMLQADLDLPGYAGGIQGVVTYNWIFPISSWTKPGSWNWYAGVGGGLGVGWSKYFFVGAAGMIGVEYNFKFPLQLSLDWRPLIGPAFGSGSVTFNKPGLFASGIGIGVRYKF